MTFRLLLVTAFIALLVTSASAQKRDISHYSFNQTGFIENLDETGSPSNVAPYRTVINGLKVDFTSEGLNYHVHGLFRTKKESHEAEGYAKKESRVPELPDEGERRIVSFEESFPVRFVNPTDSMTIEASDQKSNYVIQHGKIKQNCYERIIYRNVWPHIHMEFTIPEKGGIKYDIILDPDANVSDIQLDYSAAKNLSLIDGNLEVTSALGTWTEHAPLTYTTSADQIESFYVLKDGMLSFNIGVDEVTEPTVIDPWIELIPAITSYDDLPDPADSLWNSSFGDQLIGTGLDNAYNRVQIDYDAVGNIYLSQIACLFYESSDEFGIEDFYAVGRYVHKFNPQGELLFTVEVGDEFAVCTDITVNKTSQNFYSSRLFSNLMYFSDDGTTTDVFPIDELPENILELISMQYDHCQDKLILGLGADNDGFGSFIATTEPEFSGELDFSFAYDLSMSLPDALPFNDNIDVLIDPYSGDYFMLFLLRTFSSFTEDRALVKTDPIDVNQIWQTNGDFLYLVELAMHSVGIIQSNFGRMHYESLACGKSFVYGMNGSDLIQWNKEDGSIINELEVYPFFQNSGRAEGIDVDLCGNVYVGANNEIQVFDSLLNPLTTISLDEMPQDIEIFGNKIYVATDFEIQSIDIPEEISPWQLTSQPDSCGLCNGQGSISFCNGSETFDNITVEWQGNGDTAFNTTGLCAGWNEIIIFESKACYTNQYIDSVFVEEVSPELCSIQVNVEDQSICEGECLSITADVTGIVSEPINYEWTGGITGDEQVVEVCPTATTTYSITVEDSNGETASDDFTVTVVPIPAVDLGPDVSLCAGQEFTIDAGNSGDSYLWLDGSNEQTLTVSSTANYWVDVTTDGCTGSDTILVDFNSLVVDLGNDTTVCDLDGVLLDAGDDATEYLWQDGSTSQFYSPLFPGTFSVTATNGDCTVSDSIVIALSEIEALFERTDTTLCELIPVEFMDLSESTTNSLSVWTWDFGDGNSSGAQNPSHLYNSAGNYEITLTVADEFGCEDTFSEFAEIKVYPSPTAFFEVNPATPITFENVNFSAISGGADSWFWDLGDGTFSSEQNLIHVYENPGLYPVELTVENEFCRDRFTSVIRVGEELLIYVPNSFTPNEDGINDLFGPVISGGDIEQFEMRIFNRWGGLMFETTEINQRWNGARLTSPEASDYYAPVGKYIWQIVVKENLSTEKKELTGSLTLIR